MAFAHGNELVIGLTMLGTNSPPPATDAEKKAADAAKKAKDAAEKAKQKESMTIIFPFLFAAIFAFLGKR